MHRKIVQKFKNINTQIDSTLITIKLSNDPCDISSIYISPHESITTNDFDILTNHGRLFVETLSKPNMHIGSANTNNQHGKFLFTYGTSYLLQYLRLYLTNYSYNRVHSSDTLDIVLIQRPHLNYQFINHNDLSSDLNPVHISINDSLITTGPLKQNHRQFSKCCIV